MTIGKPKRRKMSLAEHEKRLVPPSDAEIIALAEKMWSEPVMRAAFERVGLDGDLTEDEDDAFDYMVETYLDGPLWDRDELHLRLVQPLLRRRAAGVIESLDDPWVKAFLDKRRVVRAGAMIATVMPTVAENKKFAKTMWADPKMRAIFERIGPDGHLTEEEAGRINIFLGRYKKKHGLFDLRLMNPTPLFRAIVAGRIESVNSPKARKYFEK